MPYRRQSSTSMSEPCISTPGTEYDQISSASSQTESPGQHHIALEGEVGISDADLTNFSRQHRQGVRHKHATNQRPKFSRSKTGCQTCRKRKKRCDEGKPVCLHCTRNNAVCVYEPPRTYVSSVGAQSAQNAGFFAEFQGMSLAQGIDGPIDRQLFFYFKDNLAKRLAPVDGPVSFSAIIISLAVKHACVMHSLQYLAASCLVSASAEQDSSIVDRQRFHFETARELLQKDITQLDPQSRESAIATTLLLCLHIIWNGTADDPTVLLLPTMQSLLTDPQHQPVATPFRRCATEFAIYLDFASKLSRVPDETDQMLLPPLYDVSAYRSPTPQSLLIGPLDGLFSIMYEIWTVRARARRLRQQAPDRWVSEIWDPRTMDLAERLKCLKDWNVKSGQESPRCYTSMLYRDCALIYLLRSIRVSAPQQRFDDAISHGLKALRFVEQTQQESCMDSVLLMPLFLLGCAAFNHDHRHAIRGAFERLEMRLCRANIGSIRYMVETIWRAMDEGTEEESWDWEALFEQQRWTVLIA